MEGRAVLTHGGELVTFGASVTGPAHVASGNENQDAWGTWSGPVGAVIAVADGVGSVSRAHERPGFNIETHALASTSVHPRWVTVEHEWFGPSDGVLLATDGVADDDLLTDRLRSVFARGRALVDERGAARASAALQADLQDWRTPGNLDDKTVAMLLGVAA